MRRLKVSVESWPIAGTFTISRGSRTEAHTVVATIEFKGSSGRGECVPYARYGETVEGVAAQIEAMADAISLGATHSDLLTFLAAGAARNALDCALWDLEAKLTGQRVWTLAGLPAPGPVTTAYTLSLGAPEAMEAAARKAAKRPLLKVKLGGPGDPERIAAVRRGAPNATLIADANEAWEEACLEANFAACHAAQVKLIEQPLPAGKDGLLADLGQARRGIPICADESLHTAADLPAIAQLYQAINIKLDKAGGLTAALGLLADARAHGLTVMAGCMVGTSLAMAPALLVAARADYADLDGPLLLARDREPGLVYRGSEIQPFGAEVWG
jgi:L-alanine-DL-glutamate epimerase-like enolase superfamily enzyme